MPIQGIPPITLTWSTSPSIEQRQMLWLVSIWFYTCSITVHKSGPFLFIFFLRCVHVCHRSEYSDWVQKWGSGFSVLMCVLLHQTRPWSHQLPPGEVWPQIQLLGESHWVGEKVNVYYYTNTIILLFSKLRHTLI